MSTMPDPTWPPPPPGPGPGPAPFGAGVPATAGNPAADRGWRLRHSWWLLMPILGCGCIGGFGFIYVGLRARRPHWWIAGIGYALLGWAAFATVGGTDKDNPVSDVATAMTLAVWIAGIVHAMLINPAWLRWQAQHRPWYTQPAPPAAGAPYPPAPFAPPGPAWPVGPQPVHPAGPPSAYWGTGPVAAPVPAQPVPPVPPVAPAGASVAPTGPMVDVNSANHDQLVALPGFDPARARQVLATRDARRGFGSLAEFAAAANLAPHEYARLRDTLVCLPPAGPATHPGQSHGRVLDF
ncbi:helix-hairpin-helix domain-containing protein [Micromonospora sp. IBSANI012]|uniref:helix-hairpin-helix domain-containing protein n=1 Tax=Micromonospora sp. IBSANI012 TaxID=3457761 RepID=UPI004058E297